MKRQILGATLAPLALLVSACSQQAATPPQQTSIEPAPVVQTSTNVYEQEALVKIAKLKGMMDEAEQRGFDTQREKTIIWFSEQFLTFAQWDEDNYDAVVALFGYERYYAPDKERLARELPDFERKKVIQILDVGIESLRQVLAGEITRRPVNLVDWQNTTAEDNMFVSNGKPIFPYDYFSKTVGQPLTNTDVYNDHLGALYHGGENLYPVDHDRAINSFLLKEDGTFDEELMKELTSIPDTNIGFLVYWIMGIPEWVEAREPEVRKGRSLFTGFDVDNPLARELWGKIIRRTAELTKGKKVTELGFVLANEPHWYAEKGHWTQRYKEMNSISSYTLNKFRDWLDRKYSGDISSLNTNWGTSFTNFGDVEIEIPIDPVLLGTPKWYDWSRYNMDRGTDWFTFMQSELHAVNPEADTHIKIMPRMFMYNERSGGIDVEALTELTTMIGHDAKALGSPNIRPGRSSAWIERYAYYWNGVGMFHDFIESVAPDKINVNSESHFLSSGQWRDLEMRTSYVRSVYWLATLQGMDANMGWFWARDPDGSPEDRLEGELNFFDPALAGSFAGSNNMQPHVTNEVTQVMYDLNSFSEEIVALREQKRPLRFFYTETTAINTKNYMTERFKLYEEFFFEGFPLGFVTQNIIQKQDNGLWDVVVVYQTSHVTDQEFEALQSYLDNGGTVVLDSLESLSLNEYGQARNAQLQQSKGKLVVMPEGSGIAEIKQAAMAYVGNESQDIIIEEDNGEAFKTTMWRQVQREDGSYLVNVLNLGHNEAKLSLTLRSGQDVTMTDMMTGNAVNSDFTLPSEGVLLLEVTPK
ncbi:alpha-amylase family protein [Alteromonas sp. KUL49]|uniref:alpha-amylase family protein n=1 Tax=Alteromonas sp. KUL49 TaxID=2480798 RepID=UPI00102EEBE6|nr:alpha-amylase family protein [Alteromonas sp. KUL49]TAP35930.1 glycoside hydrolase family 42 [Alteromonas sp. KUL49]GEA13321.1 hypothetical protein KUL49_36960 [Alteromonas sp. KUL49]